MADVDYEEEVVDGVEENIDGVEAEENDNIEEQIVVDGDVVAEKTKEKKKPEDVLKVIKKLRKGVENLKKRLNVRQNKKYFEPEARDPVKFEIMLSNINKLEEEYKRLMEKHKRDIKARYLLPVARKFIVDHPLVSTVKSKCPAMPRLSKGKGVGSAQMVSAYLYGYLGEYCTKVGRQEYQLDDDMKAFVMQLIGEDIEVLKFGSIRRICMSMLISGVEVLDRDVVVYKEVLEYYATQRKMVDKDDKNKDDKPKKTRKSKKLVEEEKKEEVLEQDVEEGTDEEKEEQEE